MSVTIDIIPNNGTAFSNSLHLRITCELLLKGRKVLLEVGGLYNRSFYDYNLVSFDADSFIKIKSS